MDVRRKTDIDSILVKFLGEIARWNQTTAAKLLGIDRRRFNDYYNHRRETPDEVLIKIEDILQARGIYLDKQKPEKAKKPSHSEREKQVLADKRWSERRLGRPKNAEKINCHRGDNLMEKNRIDDQLAKEYGFNSRFTMRVAISVLENGCIELIKALDQGIISFKCAAKLVRLPKSLQQELVVQGKQAILTYFKQSEIVENSGHADIATVLKLAKAHSWVVKQKKETQQSFQKVLEEILYAARC